jgi:hypothetical protein
MSGKKLTPENNWMNKSWKEVSGRGRKMLEVAITELMYTAHLVYQELKLAIIK